MDDDERRAEEIAAFLRKALEIELDGARATLSEAELRDIALRSGLNEADWQRLCEKLEGHLLKGRNFVEFENYADAIVELEEAIVLAPYRADVAYDCGRAHQLAWERTRNRENRDRAEEKFEHCLKLEPNHVGAAQALSRLRRPKEPLSKRARIAAATAVLALLGAGGIWWQGARDEVAGDAVAALPQIEEQENRPVVAVNRLKVYQSGNLVAVSRQAETAEAFPSGLPNDIVQVVSGFSDAGHQLALRENGKVIGWGDDAFGQASPPDGLEEVTQVAAGWRHSLALLSDGSVRAWGDNAEGQCDVPDGLRDVVQISAGTRHSLALRSDGSVVAWGANQKGQTEVPPGLGPVSRLAEVCSDHTVVVLESGELAAWGNNASGECDVPNAELGDSSVVKVLAPGENYALLDDGRVLHWGRPIRGKPLPPEMVAVESVFSGFPASLIVMDRNGQVKLYGSVRQRDGIAEEIAAWEKIVVGPDFIYGVRKER